MSATPKKRTKSPNSIKASPKPNLDAKRISQVTFKQPESIYRVQGATLSQSRLSKGNYFAEPETAVKSRRCSNHPLRQCEYVVSVAQGAPFCESCALKLASQGFYIDQLQQPTMSSPEQNPQERSNSGRSRVSQVGSVINQLKYMREISSYWCYKFPQDLQQHYADQLALVQNFYLNAMQYLDSIKEQHIRLITEEWNGNKELYLKIQHSLLEHHNDIQYILSDIQTNIQDVLHRVGGEAYRKCMDFYVLQMADIQQELDDCNTQILKNISCCDAKDMAEKIREFKQNMDYIFGIKQESGVLFSFQAQGSKLKMTKPCQIVESQVLIPAAVEHPNPGFRYLFQQRA